MSHRSDVIDHAQELAALNGVADAIAEADTVEALLDRAIDRIVHVLDSDLAVAFLVSHADDSLRLVAHRGLPQPLIDEFQKEPLLVGQGIVGEVAASGRVALVDEFSRDARVVRPLVRALGLRTFVAIPVKTKGQISGVIGLGSYRPGSIHRNRLAFLDALGHHLGAVVETIGLRERASAKSRELEGLTTISRQLTRLKESEPLLSLIVEEATRLLGVAGAGIRKLVGDELVLTACTKGATKAMVEPRIGIGESLSGRIVAENRPIAIYDLSGDEDRIPAHRLPGIAAGYRSFLGIPFRAHDRVIGTLNVYTKTPRHFSEDEVHLLSAFADQAAIALENARLYEAQEVRATRLRTLASLNRVVSSSLDPAVVLPAIAQAAAQLMGARLVAFWIANEAAQTLTLSHFADADPGGHDYLVPTLAYGEGGAGWVARHRRILHVDDVWADDRLIPRDWWRAKGFRSLLGVPIILDGSLLAVLVIWGQTPFNFTPDEQELLDSFVAQAAVAIRNAQLFEASERRRETAEALIEVGRALTQSLDPEITARRIVESVCAVFKARICAVYVVDHDSGDLVLLAAVGPGVEWSRTLRRGTAAVGRAVLERRPIITANILADPRIELDEDSRARIERSRFLAVLAVPLVRKDHVIGTLSVGDDAGRQFDDAAVRLLETFAAQAAIAIENARLYQESLEQRRSLTTLVEMTQRLTRGLDLAAVLGSIAEAAAMLLRGEAGFRLVEGNFLVRVGATEGALGAMVRERLRLGESLSGRVALSGEPIVNDDIAADPRVLTDHLASAQGATAQPSRTGALMCVPIRLGDRILGTLNVYRERGHRFDAEALRLVTSFADQAAVAINNARLYEDAQRALAELQAKNEELDSFVYSVSHDLKAPLVAIHGMSNILKEDYADDLTVEATHYLERIAANVDRMEQLIADLLALSRIGREARALEAVSLAEVVDEILLELGEHVRAHGIKVIHGNLATLWGIRTQVHQVMSNLISNAIRYMGDSPSPMVEIGTLDHGQFVECYVRDNGIGIDPAYHARVFELFQRLRDIEAEGTGVGLPIVKKIIEGVGGRVWVESARGEGATFRFTWPGQSATT